MPLLTHAGSGAASARLDLIGMVVALSAVAWAYLVAAVSGGSPDAFAALILAAALVFLAGRLTALVHRTLIPVIVIAVATALAVSTPDVLSSGPLSGPFGYANAKGAFFLQAAIAGLMLFMVGRTAPVKLLGLVASVAFGILPLVVKSLTPATLAFLIPVVGLSLRRLSRASVLIAGSGFLFLITLVITVVVGASYAAGDRSSLVDRIVDRTITERRAVLWHEALSMMRDDPVAGVGPGHFGLLSPTARSDRDARWAHNSFLQQGAETGLVGFLLLGLLFIWGFIRLTAAETADAMTVLGAVALAALGIHACVDYVLHFPAVPLTTAALVGASGARPGRPHEIVGKGRA